MNCKGDKSFFGLRIVAENRRAQEMRSYRRNERKEQFGSWLNDYKKFPND